MTEGVPPDRLEWEVVQVWSGRPPGSFGVRAPETRTVEDDARWRTHLMVRNVFKPSLTVVRPTEGTHSGASMVVLPGGGFGGLAWDGEGMEVGQFLADRGVTAFVLKYRVQRPTLWGKLRFLFGGFARGVEPAVAAASADAKQSMRVIRVGAERFGIDPAKVGMIGFSAGAVTMLRVLHDEDPSVRPDVAASVYGLLWEDGVQPQSTPILIAAAEPDAAAADAGRLAELWREAGAPSEVHIYESGDHGFGLGRPGTASARFAADLEQWLVERDYARPVSKTTDSA